MSSRPIGNCKAVAFEMRRPANDKAVFVNILCEDSQGNPFYFSGACFNFELKPGEPPPSDRPTQETIEARSARASE